MRRLLALAALGLAPAAALAQYDGPAVEACRGHAEAELRRNGMQGAQFVIDRDPALVIERHTRKAGSQFVSSLLFGNGAIVLASGVPTELTFLCLLADERRAVFLHWLPRRDAPVLAQCRRAREVAECLETLLLITEQDLTQTYARHYIEAREADGGRDGKATLAFRASADAWKAYRDAECGRRGADGTPPHRACVIELTRRRGRELQ